ncbi:hypothetical protein NHX12_003447 [Muraenolepis orangiensis]|uniref:Uncharacterized protein n=1 Tax=Muraenolepis orangiensis TaxID=630683 RepID=A0A9Q0E2U0_9TELE|nr:hypothetical protein NHX12_003447 [Muraenolepis orangiensis]
MGSWRPSELIPYSEPQPTYTSSLHLTPLTSPPHPLTPTPPASQLDSPGSVYRAAVAVSPGRSFYPVLRPPSGGRGPAPQWRTRTRSPVEDEDPLPSGGRGPAPQSSASTCRPIR